jgi:hypothetical protein
VSQTTVLVGIDESGVLQGTFERQRRQPETQKINVYSSGLPECKSLGECLKMRLVAVE